MRILIVTNLYPWPGQPTRGMFNVQTARELANDHAVAVRVLVPEWRVWRWPMIRRWKAPNQTADCRPQTADPGEGGGAAPRSDVCGPVSVVYLPVFYLPGIGRSLSHLTYRWSMRRAAYPDPDFPVTQGRARMVRAADGDTPSLPKAHARPTFSDTVMNYDAVLVPWLYPDGAAVAEIACRRRKPVWLMALGTDTFHLDSSRRPAVLQACARAQGIICVCQVLADRLAAAGVPRGKLHVVPNGVDSTLFRFRNKSELPCGQTATLMSGGIPGVPQKILFVGNLVPVKGPDVVLKAFAELVNGHGLSVIRNTNNEQPITNNPLLIIIGSGPMQAALECLARKLGIADRVHFLGNRPHDEVALWMNAADVLCLTSRTEGMPNVVIEALASGLPVVATDVGDCREMLAEESAARICQPGDEEGLAIAIGELLRKQTDRQALSQRHIERYSWRRQAEAIAGLMEQDGYRGSGGGRTA